MIAQLIRMLGMKGIIMVVVGGLLLGTITVKEIRIRNLEGELQESVHAIEVLRGQVAVGRANISGLKQAIHSQNDAIENMRRHSEHRAAEAARVLEESAKLKAELDSHTVRLSAAQGESCEEGISLLDRELGL